MDIKQESNPLECPANVRRQSFEIDIKYNALEEPNNSNDYATNAVNKTDEIPTNPNQSPDSEGNDKCSER